MYELLGATGDQLNQANMAHATNHLTLLIALVEKGILSDDEIESARIQATHFVEQEWAKKREEALIQWSTDFPASQSPSAESSGA